MKLPFSVDDQRATIAQLRWQRDRYQALSWSAGMIHRKRLHNDWVLGLGGHLDSTKDDFDNRFSQVSFGAELFGKGLEARLNTYLPFGSKSEANSAYDTLIESDGTIRFRSGRTVAMRGADAELGARFGFESWGSGSLGIFAGGFVFDNSESGVYRGTTARAEFMINNLFQGYEGVSLRAGVQGERASGETDHYAYFTLSIPFGKSANKRKTNRDNMLTQDVIRRERVTTRSGAFGAAEAVSIGGREVAAFQRVNAGQDLTAALAAAGENSIVFVSGDFAATDGLTLSDGQVIVGGGTAVMLHSDSSGRDMALNNTAEAARIVSSDSNSDVVTMADNSGFAGFALSGGRHGIAANDVSDFWVQDVTVSGSADDAIMLSNASNGRFTGVNIGDAGGNGVSVNGGRNISMSNVTIAKPTENGFLLRNTDGFALSHASLSEMPICDVNSLCEFSIFSPNNVPNSGVNAVGITNASFDNITMRDVTYGFFLGSEIAQANFQNSIGTAASNISLSNISITNSRREGILAVAVDDLTMRDITIDNSQQVQDMDLIVLQSGGTTTLERADLRGGINGLMFVNGLALDANAIAPDMEIRDVTIGGTSRAGIFLNPVSNVSFSNVAISNAGTHGIHFLGDSFGFNGGPVTNISFENVSIDSATTSGVNFFGPVVDAKGDITVSNTSNDCAALTGPFYGTTLTNTDGDNLQINGTTMTTGSLSSCGAPF